MTHNGWYGIKHKPTSETTNNIEHVLYNKEMIFLY